MTELNDLFAKVDDRRRVRMAKNLECLYQINLFKYFHYRNGKFLTICVAK